MINKKEILRKCIITNKVYPCKSLLRFSKSKAQNIYFDPEFKDLGRGAYVYNDSETIKILFQKKMLNRAFKMNISNKRYEELWDEVNTYEKKQKNNKKI